MQANAQGLRLHRDNLNGPIQRCLAIDTIPRENPLGGVELDCKASPPRRASRKEAYALHEALVAACEPLQIRHANELTAS